MAGMKRLTPALAFAVAAFLTRLPVLHRSILDWDESLYFLMAQAWRAGHLPYSTIWDNKPIGIYVIFALFQSVIPSIAAIRVASMVCAALLAWTVFRITELITENRMAAWCAGIALIICSLANDGLSANTELFMACCTALAVLAVLADAPAWSVGLALGCAFMIKYVSAPEAPLVLLLLLHRRRSFTAAAICIAAAFIPFMAALALYAAHGQLALWWASTVLGNIRRTNVPVTPLMIHYAFNLQVTRWGPLYVMGLGWLPYCFIRKAPFEQKFLGLWLLGGLAGALSAKSLYDHYFLQMLPALCVIFGAVIALARDTPMSQLRMLGFAMLLPLWADEQALQWGMSTDYVARAARDIRAAHPASIYVFDSQPILYALTGLPSPTRYVLPTEVMGNFLPQVAGVNPVAEITRILATNPAMIIRHVPQPQANIVNDDVYAIINQIMANNYTLWRQYPEIAIYRRNDQRLSTASSR